MSQQQQPTTARQIAPMRALCAHEIAVTIEPVDAAQPERFGYTFTLSAGGTVLAVESFWADADAARRNAERRIAELVA